MKIKCLTGTVAKSVNGETLRLKAGEVADVSDRDGILLCNMKKAELAGDEPAPDKPAGLSTDTGPAVRKSSRKKRY